MPASIRKIIPQIRRKEASSAVIVLTAPISKNELRTLGKGRFVDSAAYKSWKRSAGWELCIQRPGLVAGPYALRIIVSRSFGLDLGNAEQAISDLIQSHGVVENDNLCERIELCWSDEPGVKIIVTSAKTAEAAA